MLNFFSENWGTILIGFVILAAVILILVKMKKDRKKGKTSCGCGCENCPSSGMCHKE